MKCEHGKAGTHHLHVFEQESIHIKRHLAFKEYLIVFPEETRKYEDVKYESLANCKNDIVDIVN